MAVTWGKNFWIFDSAFSSPPHHNGNVWSATPFREMESLIREVGTVQLQSSDQKDLMSLFKPPVHRSAAAVLDRALFKKTIPISAARITDTKLISKCRGQLMKTKELLHGERLASVRSDPDASLAAKGIKCLLLKPDIKPNGMRSKRSPWRLGLTI